MSRPALLRLGAALLLGLTLSGCLGNILGGGGKPAQLYTFGVAEPANAPPQARSVNVFRANSTFQRESAGDRILAIDGGEASYIALSRWVAPAQVLFGQAVLNAFDSAPGKVRLVSRGEPAKTDLTLRLDVRNFETRYENGPKAAPVVLVRIRAALSRDQDRSLAGEKVFEVEAPASDNRVSAIVQAYDKAVGDVLGQIIAWTNALAS
jgi:cholesterol transport system auxiliary component